MNETLIFAVSHNCSKITRIMLSSFHKHHPSRKIHVIGTQADLAELEDMGKHPNTIFVDISSNQVLLDKFKQGHAGTTTVFAMVIKGMIGQNIGAFIHIDGDVFFKRESISTIENAFENGYDIVGTRRCYGNNPSGIKNLEKFPDTISTYFFGMKLNKIPNYDFDALCRYCQGAAHPIEGYIALDCFDGVTHGAMLNGAKVMFLDQNEFGSQDIHGKKVNNYHLNMHMDCGSHLIHFGGTGSGYAYFTKKSSPEKGYAEWALGKYSMFAKLFYKEDIGYSAPIVYGPDGRWINGNYDYVIMEQVQKEVLGDAYTTAAHRQWVADDADHLRYDFDLDEYSLVVDAGGFTGEWASKIFCKYGCAIHVYEPVTKYFLLIKKIFEYNNIIGVFNAGLLDSSFDKRTIYINDDASSSNSISEESQIAKFLDFNEHYKNTTIDLLKINIEGDEYPLLNSIVERGNPQRIKNILIQFHKNVEGHDVHKKHIETELSKTHDQVFNYDYIWTLWRIKTK